MCLGKKIGIRDLRTFIQISFLSTLIQISYRIHLNTYKAVNFTSQLFLRVYLKAYLQAHERHSEQKLDI